MILLVLGGLLLDGGRSSAPANPYQAIPDRNVFGLKPPPPPTRPEDIKQPPPDIKLTGITTILGRKLALLKVPAKPPQIPKEESYILGEGQRDGDVEVLAIDELAATVKISHRGTVLTLDFANNGIKVPTASSLPANPQPGVIPPPNVPPPPGMNVPAPGKGPPSMGMLTPRGSIGRQIPLRQVRAIPAATTPEDQISAQQTLLIEAERDRLLQAGDQETATMMPHTELSLPSDGDPVLPQ